MWAFTRESNIINERGYNVEATEEVRDLQVTLAHLEQLANWLLQVQQPVDMTALLIKYADILREEAGLENA